MTEEAGGVPADPAQGSTGASGRLRLRASTDLAEIADITLEELVPGFADAAVLYTAEGMFRDSVPALTGTVRQDALGRVPVRRAGARFTRGGPGTAAFPAGEAVVFVPGSPYARCVSDGKPVAFTRPDDPMTEEAVPGSREFMSRYASFLAVPLEAGGAVAGLLTLACEPARPAFGGSDIDGIMRIASAAGTAIANVMKLERHRGITDALQRGLLAAEPAPPGHLDMSARCLPAGFAEGNMVGGDWYDIIALPGDRTGIVVGDVMGHGIEAAAAMAQLRAAARVLAQMDTGPAELLTRLNQLIPTLCPEPMATCLYAVIDPAGQCCTLAAAGHLPPVLALPGSPARPLELPDGMSLGVGASAYGQARITLPPGAVIAFYTDGLVETRTRSFGQGISALCSGLGDASGPLNATLDAIIGLLAGQPEDDVTLLLARIPG